MINPRFTSPATTHANETEVTVHRQPVVRPDRSVHGYAVCVLVRAPLTQAHRGEELAELVHAQYDRLDLATIVAKSVAFVRATTGMLIGARALPPTAGDLVLEVPRNFAEVPDAADRLTRLRAAGVGLALADYVPGGAQDDLLGLVDFVKVDLGRGDDVAAAAIAHAHSHHVKVIAERVATESAVEFCADHGVELLQGPLCQRDATPSGRDLTTGEIQCLELMALLSADEIDERKVVALVGADPELAIRVLGLVNSSAIGVRRRIDSIAQAVMLLGPRALGTLAAASLVDARSHSLAALWFVLTRAIACRSLAGDDAGYTVGLLSAVAAQMRVAPALLVARAGVSDDVGDALLTKYGPYGPVLAAVLAHEENDVAGVQATGLEPLVVAQAYLAAVGDALRTATSVAGPRSQL